MTAQDADRLAAESYRRGDPTGWFDRLYASAAAGRAQVPWDRGAPHPLLREWTEQRGLRGEGRRALVVGCGLGHDAEHLAALGFDTIAFDVAPGAVRAAEATYPRSHVQYRVADLREPPPEWSRAFDFVFEALTVQSVPDPPRREMIANVGRFVAAGGTLLVVAAARAEDEPVEGPPWPLTPSEIRAFSDGDLAPVEIERLVDAVDFNEIARWRAEFSRPPEQH